jgi:hypothetical protein
MFTAFWAASEEKRLAPSDRASLQVEKDEMHFGDVLARIENYYSVMRL